MTRKRINSESFLSQSSGSSDNDDEDLPDIPTTSSRNHRNRNNNDTIDRRAVRNVSTFMQGFGQALVDDLVDANPANQEIEARERADALHALQAQRAKNNKEKGKQKERREGEDRASSASGSSNAKRRRVIIGSEDEEQDELQEDDQDEDDEVASRLLNQSASQSHRAANELVALASSQRALATTVGDAPQNSTAPPSSSSSASSSHAGPSTTALQTSTSTPSGTSHSTSPNDAQIVAGLEYPNGEAFIRAAQTSLTNFVSSDLENESTETDINLYGDRVTVKCNARLCDARTSGRCIEKGKDRQARPKHSEACMRLGRPPTAARETVITERAASRVLSPPPHAAPTPSAQNPVTEDTALPQTTFKAEEVDVMLNDTLPESAELPPAEETQDTHHQEELVQKDAPEPSATSRTAAIEARDPMGQASGSRQASASYRTARQTATPSTTTSRGVRGKRRYAEPPSPSPDSAYKPALSQYRRDGTPRVPKPGCTYDSAQELETRIRAYSKFRNPSATLRNDTKRKDTLSLSCSHRQCDFHFLAENDRRKGDDAVVVVVQGMSIRESQPQHSQACMSTSGEASSPLAISAPKRSLLQSSGRASTLSNPNTAGFSDVESIVSSSKRSRKRPSTVLPAARKNRRTSTLNAHVSRREQADVSATGDRSVTPVDSGTTEVEHSAGTTSLHAPGILAGSPVASNRAQSQREIERHPAKEPMKDERYSSVQDFESVVRAHNRYANPESKITVSTSADGRVVITCTKKPCTYSFVGKRVTNSAASPVLVKSTNPLHSLACLAYYNHPGYRYAPKKGETVESWERFQQMVEAHSEKLNPGAELDKQYKEDWQKIFCDGDEEVRCNYQFTARYFPRGENIGQIEITKSEFIHSDDCLEHYGNLVRPGNRSSGSRAEAAAADAAAEETAEPGTLVNTIFDDENDFKGFVTEHSERKAPGAALLWKHRKTYISCECKYYHAGCRYEFHAARYFDEAAKKEKLILTNITQDHNQGCENERKLAGPRLVKKDSSEGSLRPRRSKLQRNGSRLAHLSASGAFDSSWQENDNMDTTMIDASTAESSGPLAAPALVSRPALKPETTSQVPILSPNMASPAQTPPITDFSAVPDRPSAYVVASSPAAVAPTPFVDENLDTIYLPHGVLPILQQFGYNRVSDLSQAGVTNADWPSLLQHLEELASFSHLEGKGESLLNADPVADFIFEKRAAAALSLEYIHRYHASTRFPEIAADEPLQL